VAAAALAAFRSEKWAADALTPNAVLNIELQVPPIVHTVPLTAVERWLRSPNASPRELLIKQRTTVWPEAVAVDPTCCRPRTTMAPQTFANRFITEVRHLVGGARPSVNPDC
jgi:hypothetical protein